MNDERVIPTVQWIVRSVWLCECMMNAGDIWTHGRVHWFREYSFFFSGHTMYDGAIGLCISRLNEIRAYLSSNKFFIYFIIYMRHNLTLRCHSIRFVCLCRLFPFRDANRMLFFISLSRIDFVLFTISAETHLSWGFPQSDWYFASITLLRRRHLSFSTICLFHLQVLGTCTRIRLYRIGLNWSVRNTRWKSIAAHIRTVDLNPVSSTAVHHMYKEMIGM